MKILLILPLLILYNAIVEINADPKTDGNCMTGRIYFNPSRIIVNDSLAVIDPKLYDMTIDYGASLVNFDGSGAHLSVQKNPSNGQAFGTRMSTTRYIQYGKITAKLSAISVTGIVTTFITMSDRKDEIDWEILGATPTKAQTNVFYKGIAEFVIHNTEVNVPRINNSLEYTIDWRSDRIIWSVNGVVKRTLFKNQSTSSKIPSNERWFPSTPSLIQLAVWDGGSSPDNGTSKWAGGPVQWGNNMQFTTDFDYIDIQCYNDKNQVVNAWPSQDYFNITIPRTSSATINGASLGFKPKKIEETIMDETNEAVKKELNNQNSESVLCSFAWIFSLLGFFMFF